MLDVLELECKRVDLSSLLLLQIIDLLAKLKCMFVKDTLFYTEGRCTFLLYLRESSAESIDISQVLLLFRLNGLGVGELLTKVFSQGGHILTRSLFAFIQLSL